MIEKVWKPLGFLIIFIILCAVTARLITKGETLTDYAQDNPKTAYATPEKAGAPNLLTGLLSNATPSPSPMPSMPSPFSESEASQSGNHTEDVTSMSEIAGASSTLNVPNTVYYQEGFYYQPLSEKIIEKITGISYPVHESKLQELSVSAINIIDDEESPEISYEQLRYLSLLYYDFNGEVQTGELICNAGLAQDMIEIFYELFQNEYQIEKIRLIDEYNGDDDASMADNNTSCFNYRVVDGTTTLSKHAFGCAIDINPFYNPYVIYNRDGSGQDYICPEGSEPYADRSQNFPYKIDTDDLCYRLFTEHGFIWGGNWNSCKDYQHFQKVV